MIKRILVALADTEFCRSSIRRAVELALLHEAQVTAVTAIKIRELADFPFRFTAYNDLSLAYLVPRVMEDQERIAREVGVIARQLRADIAACDLANEILRAEQAHLDNPCEILGGKMSEPCRNSAVGALSERRGQEHATSVATAA